MYFRNMLCIQVGCQFPIAGTVHCYFYLYIISKKHIEAYQQIDNLYFNDYNYYPLLNYTVKLCEQKFTRNIKAKQHKMTIIKTNTVFKSGVHSKQKKCCFYVKMQRARDLVHILLIYLTLFNAKYGNIAFYCHNFYLFFQFTLLKLFVLSVQCEPSKCGLV